MGQKGVPEVGEYGSEITDNLSSRHGSNKFGFGGAGCDSLL